MTRAHSFLACVLYLGAALALNACGAEPNANPTDSTAAQPQQPTSVSKIAPPTKPFTGIATPVRDYPRVASSGRCGPLYKNGTRGNCIAEKPCRGYGIRNDENQVLCMCYLTQGGCDAKSRCDDRQHACVADTKQRNTEE